MTEAQFLKVVLGIPGAQQKSHFGRPDFRINNKIFATTRPGQGLAVVKLTLPDQSALLQMQPEAFSLNPWSRHGWTNVHLKHISSVLARQVVTASWRLVAPKKLVASLHPAEKAPTGRRTAKPPRDSRVG